MPYVPADDACLLTIYLVPPLLFEIAIVVQSESCEGAEMSVSVLEISFSFSLQLCSPDLLAIL